jgi:hypothetical protein
MRRSVVCATIVALALVAGTVYHVKSSMAGGAFLLNVGSDGSDGDLVAQNTVVTIDLSQAVTASWDTPSPVPGLGVYDPAKWGGGFQVPVGQHHGRGGTLQESPFPGTRRLARPRGRFAEHPDRPLGQGRQFPERVSPEPGPGGFRGGYGYDVGSLIRSGGFGPGGGARVADGNAGGGAGHAGPGLGDGAGLAVR